LPIAVFLDGWQFHKDSIPADLAKRLAVAKSGKFSVWTLTWDDIDCALQGKDSATLSPWPTLLSDGAGNVVPKVCAAQGLPESIHGLKSLSPFMQLHRRLASWRHEDLRRLAVALAIGMVMPPGEATALEALRQGAFWRRLDELSLLPDTQKCRIGVRQLGSALSLAAGIEPDHLAVLLSGKGDGTQEPVVFGEWTLSGLPEAERLSRWQQLWQTLNLLLPLRHTWVGAADMPGLEALRHAAVLQTQDTGLSAAWNEALGLVLQEVRTWALALAQSGAPAPLVGYELLDAKGRVIAEAEMAWKALQVAVVMPGADAQSHFLSAGWTCFVVADGVMPAALVQSLKEAKA
jgi:DEAD/DEAH box helicase domain-containing protein